MYLALSTNCPLLELRIDKRHTKAQVIEIKCCQNHPNMANTGDMFQFSAKNG